jgi:creatinine amidohydrolase
VGVKKFVILNGHGGNDFRQMLRELQGKHPKMFLSTVSWFNAVKGDDIFDILGDHADERETSLILHLHPNLVLPKSDWGTGTDNRWKLKAINEKWAWAQRDWLKATNDTGSGDPQHSTAEKGQRYLEALGAKIGSYLVELAQADIAALYERP